MCDNGYSCLVDLAYSVSTGGDSHSQASLSEFFRLVLKEFRSELKEEALRPVFARTLYETIRFHDISILADVLTILDIKLDDIDLDEIDLDEIDLDDTTIDAAAEPGGFSLLHYVIRTRKTSLASYNLVNFLVGFGADVHRLGYKTRHQALFPESCRIQSRTAVAMRFPTSFYIWRATLVENEYCLKCFVIREVQNSPLVSQGWTRETLLALFMYDFRPLTCICNGFAECHNKNSHQSEWEKRLEMIQQGKILDAQELDHQTGTNGTPPKDGTKKSCLKCGHAMSARGLTE